MPLTDMYTVLSPDPCKDVEKQEPPVPTTISLQDARDVLYHDAHHAWDLKRIVIALLSFAIFIAALFVHAPTRTMYLQSYAVSSTVANSGSDTITDASPMKFLNIETIPDVFDWLNYTFVPQVFVTEDYEGNTLPEQEWGRIAMFNQILGGVSFEVTNMQPRECNTQAFLRKLYGGCWDEEHTMVEEFVIRFNANVSEARSILDEKSSGNWLGFSTKQLLITVPTLNAEIPGYVVTKLKLDFKAGGYIKPSYSTTPTRSDQFPDTRTIVVAILVVVWFSPWMLILAVISHAREYNKKYRPTSTSSDHTKNLCREIIKVIGAWSIPDGWMAIDALRGPMVHAFYVTVIITHLATTDAKFQNEIASLQDGSLSGDEADVTLTAVIKNFSYIAQLSVWMRLLATAAVSMQGLRVLSTFRNHLGLSLLTRSMKKALQSCGAFSMVFSVIFMVFAVSGAVLFGSRVHEFSSLLNSMRTCINMLFGDFNLESIQDIHYSVAFYWIFMTLEMFVLLNIVLAIVVDAYSVEKEKKEKTKWWQCRRVIIYVLRRCAAKIVDFLTSQCCWADVSRHKVIFWGRIRSRKLREALNVKLGSTSHSEENFQWAPETILTAESLLQLFPQATLTECENTIQFLVEGICHEDHEETCTNFDSNMHTATSTRTHSPEMLGSMHQLVTMESQTNEATRLEEMEAKLKRLEQTLNQKLDILVEKMAQL